MVLHFHLGGFPTSDLAPSELPQWTLDAEDAFFVDQAHEHCTPGMYQTRKSFLIHIRVQPLES